MRNFCENCGARRKEGTDFCVQCGKPFTSAPPAPQAALSSERPCLVVTGGQANSLFADLSRGTVTIGRARSNTLVLNDSDVSRQHARVGFENGEWVISDLNSRNGTFVNGEPVTRQALRPGDQIRLGRTVLAFQSAPPAAPPHVKPSRLPPPERPAPTHARQSPCIVLLLAAAGLVILVLVAASAIAVVWWAHPPDQSLKLTPLASQTLQPSSEPQTVNAQDKVSVIVPGGLLTRSQTLTISEVENPPAIKNQVFEPGRVYDISLDEQHEFDQPITIELKYDASKLSSEMSVDAQVRLAYWDPVAQGWSLLPTAVDATRQVAVARMDHLSIIGERYLNSPGYRDYDPRFDREDKFPHFRLIYDSRVSLGMELPERRPGTFDYQNRWVAVNTVEDYARYVGTEAERTYKIYLDKGLLEKNLEKGQEKTDIIVGDFRSIWGRQLDDETHPFGGAIFIRHDHGKLADLRHVVAHEMFHIVQLRKARFGAYANDRMFWFTEASAEYAACRIAWSDIPAQSGVPKPICQMGEGIKARFLRQTLEYRVTGSDTDPDNNHLYHASHFLDYLINGQPGVGIPKYGEDAARFNDIWGIMMLQLQTRGEIDALTALRQWAGGSFDFDEAFQDFTAYFLFNTNGPMPANPKNKVPNEALGDLTNGLLLTDTEIKSNPIQLPARYTAALWEVAVQIDPAKQSREVVVETEGALPVDVHLNVYQSGKDNQRADYGQWGGPEPVCHLSSKDVCTISVSEPQNLLNIVVVNASENQASVVVKVSAVQDEPVIRKTPSAGTGKCICEDGTPLTCDPEFEGWMDGFVLEVTLWEQSDLQWCYHDCLRECGCDPEDPDLSCAHKCICGQ